MLNILDSQYGGVFKGPVGLYGCLEGFLPTMGVFSVFPDPTHMGVFSGVDKTL